MEERVRQEELQKIGEDLSATMKTLEDGGVIDPGPDNSPHALTSNMLETLPQVDLYVKKYFQRRHPLLSIGPKTRWEITRAAMYIVQEFGAIRLEDVAIIVESWRLTVLISKDKTDIRE